MLRHFWGCRTTTTVTFKNWNTLGRVIIEGDNPVQVIKENGSGILSRAGPGKSCLNLAAPSAKAKYY